MPAAVKTRQRDFSPKKIVPRRANGLTSKPQSAYALQQIVNIKQMQWEQKMFCAELSSVTGSKAVLTQICILNTTQTCF